MRSGKFKNYFNLFVITLLVFSATASATTYYVDATDGDDGAAGTSAGTAWQNLSKVNSTTFSAGDIIKFQCGESWSGLLWPKGSGTSGSPIKITYYGDTGNGYPHIAGPTDGVTRPTVYLYNQEYWEICDLEITHYDSTNNNIKRHGVMIHLDEPNLAGTQVLNHIYLNNLEVHNINGDPSNYNAAALYFTVSGDGTAANKAWFNDVNISDCHIHDVNSAGFINWSDFSYRTDIDDANWAPWTNFVMRGNTFNRISGRALHTRYMDSPLVEYNLAFGNNYVYGEGEEANCFVLFGCDDSIWQFNEVYDTAKFAGEPDGGAYDLDYRSKNSICQYNYSHDNGMAWSIPCNGSSSINFNINPIVRYNISQNETVEVSHLSGGVDGAKFYNNTAYIGSGLSGVLIMYHKSWGGYSTNTSYFNNIFYNLGTASLYDFGSSTNNTFDNNVFYGNAATGEPSDSNKITSDPQLVWVGSGGTGLDSVDGYMLLPTSPCIDDAIVIDSNNGGFDYWSNVVPANSVPDVGAYEHPMDADDNTAPTPSTMTWVLDPNASGLNITMTATTATDPNGCGIQYYFDCTAGGGNDSGWQGNPTYTDTGLAANTSYTYRVKARDVSLNYNENTYSATKSATTPNVATYHVAPEADSYVRGGSYANTNYGTETTMAVKTNADETICRRDYLRFSLADVNGTVTSAKLRLYVNRRDAATSHGCNYVSDDTWGETTITWNNKPAAGSRLDTLSVPAAGTWIEFDVTDKLKTELPSDDKVSFMIWEPTATTYCLYDSKEGTYDPNLVIVTTSMVAGKATSPSPADSATDVSKTADLSWTADANANSHDVYFGTDSTPDAGEFKGNQDTVTYDPGTMAASTTYYWRIDERSDEGVTTGDVWSFTTAAGTITTLYPGADAYVRGGSSSGNNYGTETILAVKDNASASYNRRSYLKFDVSSITGTVTDAKLRLYVSNATTSTHDCDFVSTDSWTETGITWNNKPSGGSTLDSSSVPAVGNWVEFDVTSQVSTEAAGDDTISFLIQTGSVDTDYGYYDSKEGTNDPELVITH